MLRSISLAVLGATMLVGLPAFAQGQGGPVEGPCTSVKAPNTNYPGPFQIYFDLGKSNIRADEQANIATIAQAIKDNQITRVCLQGTADKIGNAAFNKKLSQDRSKAVAAALMAKGIPGKSLIYNATGEAYGGITLGTVDEQKKDRRVIVILAK